MMYLKLDGTTILAHSWTQNAEYTQEIEDIRLVNNQGEYIYKYDSGLVELTEQEILDHPTNIANKMAIVRAERNQRLIESDWTQIPDSPLSTEDKTSWATYRQSLRDLPNQPEFDPDDFEWQVEPS